MSNWEKTMKEWDDSIPDGIKYLSAENRVLTRKVRELESENDALQARAEKAEEMVEWLIELGNPVVYEYIQLYGWTTELSDAWHALVTEWKEQQ